jgi:ABC-2 type transport system permease protein
MFIKQYYYTLKDFLLTKSLSFWALLFPFLLGTLFYLSFGSMLTGGNTLEPIKTAVVIDTASEEGTYFQEILTVLSEGDDPILSITETTLSKAENLLADEKVAGILTVSDRVELIVNDSGVNQTILKNIVDSYLHRVALIEDTMETTPEQVEDVIASFSKERLFLEETTFSKTKVTGNAQYFYALIAMTCLYGSFFGLCLGTRLQANLSSLAMRRVMGPTKKIKIFLADFLAAFTIDAGVIALLFSYLILVFKIDFGDHIFFMLLTAFMGSLFGISVGTVIAASNTKSFDFKVGISLGISMVFSFLSGLMVGSIPYTIEAYAPIVNRLNPAMLISNSFYCLTFYDNYNIYTRNMITLAVYVIVLSTASILLLRRQKYASL